MDTLFVVPGLATKLVGDPKITGLPEDHWLYKPRSLAYDIKRDVNADTPLPFVSKENRNAVRMAAQWAIRSATDNGQVADFDPDAMVQSFVYALCGPGEMPAIKNQT